jgi:acyl dehydratase
MDFRIEGKTSAQVLAYVQQQPEIRYAYAIDSQYVHMDSDIL